MNRGGHYEQARGERKRHRPALPSRSHTILWWLHYIAETFDGGSGGRIQAWLGVDNWYLRAGYKRYWKKEGSEVVAPVGAGMNVVGAWYIVFVEISTGTWGQALASNLAKFVCWKTCNLGDDDSFSLDKL
jgi:hypothetical protein